MKKKTVIILLGLVSVLFFTATAKAFQSSEENLFDDHITIDGRTYKVSPDFSIPVGIDKDSPVKLNFSDETHELLSIERMTDDDSDNDQLEYHFGIVNAISRASTDLEYRVYVDGTECEHRSSISFCLFRFPPEYNKRENRHDYFFFSDRNLL